jgi:hypothetical protein
MKRNLIKLLVIAAVPLAVLCSTPPVHATDSLGIVYYLQSAGGVGSGPLPFDPCSSAVPVVEVSPGVYLVEDGSGSKTTEATSLTATGVQTEDAGGPPSPGGGGSSTNSGSGPIVQGSSRPINTNELWIQCTNVGGGNLGLNLHSTVNGDNYQLLFTTNLLNYPWDLGEIIIGASSGETPFPSTVSITNGTAMFFKAHHAFPVIEIVATSSAIEPTTNVSGEIGIFQVSDEVSATNNVTVYYTISGTATNGVDYVTIGETVSIPANQFSAFIQIVPIAVGITPDKTIVLTLVQNTNYLIDPSSYCATNELYSNPDVYPVAYGDYEQVCPNATNTFGVEVADPMNLTLSYTIVTNAAHGTVSIDSSGNVTYTTSGFEGADSFAYTATCDGFTCAPAVVTMNVSAPTHANAVQVQTCRNTPVTVPLSGWDSCNQPLTYTIVVNPTHGQVTGLSGNTCVYTSTGTNFTGTDSFMYMATVSTGEWATNVVTVTVGDTSIFGNYQDVLTGTNIPVAITLNAGDTTDICQNTNNVVYAVTSGPANGKVTGSGANLTYTPNAKFEGTDSFQFTASDGVWTSLPATVTIYVVGAANLSNLTNQCAPFSGSAWLEWTEDSTTTAMLQYGLTGNPFFVIGRSTNSSGPFSVIATNVSSLPGTYSDGSALSGQTYYYVVTLGFTDGYSQLTFQSAFSNTNRQTAQSADLIAPASLWYVTDWNEIYPTNINTNVPALTIYTNSPNVVAPVFTNWVSGPFAHPMNYAALYGSSEQPPLPPAVVNSGWTWTNTHTIWAHCVLNLTGYTSQQLSNVVYSTAIDNGYLLYINRTNVNQNPSEVYWNGAATWGQQSKGQNAFSPLPYIVAGTNTVDVVFWGDNSGNEYFSMVVTTNTCDW